MRRTAIWVSALTALFTLAAAAAGYWYAHAAH
jgi:hypothetical protein